MSKPSACLAVAVKVNPEAILVAFTTAIGSDLDRATFHQRGEVFIGYNSSNGITIIAD